MSAHYPKGSRKGILTGQIDKCVRSHLYFGRDIRTEMATLADVFLSHHVGSMNKYVCQLGEKLKTMGISAFICTNMKPGADFRHAITVNAVKCKIFIPFINEAWAKSEECIFEFNCALRSYTTTKTPQIAPIIIGGFGWIDVLQYPDVYNITANTNCAVLNADNWDKVFEEIVGTIEIHPELSKKVKGEYREQSKAIRRVRVDAQASR